MEYADVDSSPTLEYASVAAPRSIDADQPTDYWDISLEEVVRHALDNSKVMRDLGGIVLRTPDQAPTTLDPSIQETDPQLGVAAAHALLQGTRTAQRTRISYKPQPRAAPSERSGQDPDRFPSLEVLRAAAAPQIGRAHV